MLSDIEADNLPAVVGKDEHHEQEPEGRRRPQTLPNSSLTPCNVTQTYPRLSQVQRLTDLDLTATVHGRSHGNEHRGFVPVRRS